MRFYIFLVISSLFFLLPFVGSAQKRNDAFEQYKTRRNEEFNSYRENRRKEFDEYRRKRNEDFAKQLTQPWKVISPQQEIPVPNDIKPVPPVLITERDTQNVMPNQISYDEVIKIDPPKKQPEPIVPIDEIGNLTLSSPTVSFKFFGTPVKVRFDTNKTFRLKSIKESDIAHGWIQLSGDEYTNLIHDCLNIRKNLNLCDWAYLLLLEQMSDTICGKGTNESVLLMAFVYNQSGYKMRLAENDGHLYMLFASEHIIYNWRYFKDDSGDFLYVYNQITGEVRIQNGTFPNERPLSLIIDQLPKYTFISQPPISHQSKKYSEMNITVTANQNMLNFYSSYPCSSIGDNMVTQWGNYANAPMPQHIAKQLYPQIKRVTGDCDQLTAVNKILNLIQTGFEYEYDEKVWGHERAFFPEESLFYPYCDCEDRTILFTRIVRDLLNLKCLLLYYPNHLAAAVELPNNNVDGDFIEYNGMKFYVADPTIIGVGASVGISMRGKDNGSAKLLMLD